MPKICLIHPKFVNERVDRNIKTIFPLGLGYLAAHLPDHWDVEIVDEQLESIDFDMDVDAVGITTTTITANRAYEVAAAFRERGVPVFMGGVHASVCPEEAKQFCDAVCIGDGEHVISEMLSDLENDCLKDQYVGKLEPLDGRAYPRRDLFRDDYQFMPVNTTRGCPFSCHFCVINEFYRGSYRKRDVEDVIEELKGLTGEKRMMFFTDGNMVGYSKADVVRFKELCRRMKEERDAGRLRYRSFMGYASVNALDDQELLDLASAAGCSALFVGFESINPESLKNMNKVLNLKYGVDSYFRLVRNAQKRKIAVVGEMIVGNDADDASVLRDTQRFLKRVDFDILRLQILQPIPGTKLFDSLQKEGRLHLKNFPEDWKKAEQDFIMGVHFDLKNLTAIQLKRWVKETGLKFYRPSQILRRAWKTFRLTKDAKWAFTLALINFKSRKSYANVDIYAA